MAAPNRFFILNLPQLPVNTDPKIEPDLRDIYNSLRTLSYLLGQYGGFESADDGLNTLAQVAVTAGVYKRRVYCQATEVMPHGAVVNLFDSGGLAARFANATNNTRPCYGVNNTPGTCAIGDTIEVALPGCYVTSIAGLTPGVRYFLSTVDGLITNAVPGVVGNVQQALGFALTANMLFFAPDMGWTVV